MLPALQAALQVTPLSPARTWSRAEFRIDGVPATKNNFDPDVIRVDATFLAPSGAKSIVPAFWFQDYSRALVAGAEVLTPRGAPEWRLRFTPTETGEYAVTVTAGGPDVPPTTATARFTSAGTGPTGPHGWVRVAADRRYFETSDGQALRLIGENVCWAHGRGTYDYDSWFPAMHASGQNFARLWMAPWWAGIEHTPGTLTRYKLEAAWQLDHLFDLAETNGLYLLFCFDHHGMFFANDPTWGGSNNFWSRNPYAKENGGPCATPDDFFTSPAARGIYEKRLRYLVARYGWSPHLLAWQFFNEIDNAYIPRSNLVAADVVAWHRDMARALRAQDPYRHLISTSLTGGSDRPAMWQLPELDFTVYHSYSDPAPGRKVASVAADFFRRYDKPVLIGEFGVSARDWGRPLDPHLRGFRQALWSGALGGSVGTSMSWWWEDIDADRAYPLYAAMHTILQRAGWTSGTWTPLDLATPPPPADLAAPLPGGEIFNAPLALNSFRRIVLQGDAAIADPLSAERCSEFLSGFLRGSRQPDEQRPLRVLAWFAPDARLVFHVESVGGATELVVRVDGTDVRREQLGSPGATGSSHKVDREFAVPVPAGKHWIEIADTGPDWANLDLVRLEQVRPSAFTGGWKHRPEAVGLRQGARAALYVYSPWMVFPAGQYRYDGPLVHGQSLTLRNWPAGRYRAEWLSPTDGRSVARTEAATDNGVLEIPLPDFSDDLAGIVTRVAD